MKNTMIGRMIRKLFLVKEIVSKYGQVHFRRYRLIQTPWFAIYIHQIMKSDEDIHLHDHPWAFTSVILSGAYQEMWKPDPKTYLRYDNRYQGDVVVHAATDAHKLTLLSKEVWTMVFTSGRQRVWGYQTPMGWIPNDQYREMKNQGLL